MNRKEIIKVFVLIITTILSLIFTVKMNQMGSIIYFGIMCIPALTILELFRYEKSSSSKRKIVLGIMIFLSLIMLAFVLSACFVKVTSWSVGVDGVSPSVPEETYISFSSQLCFSVIYYTSLFSMLFISFDEMAKDTNKVNWILTLIASVTIIGILLKFFINGIIDLSILSPEGESFVSGYFLCFSIMYILILIHKFIYKRLQK